MEAPAGFRRAVSPKKTAGALMNPIAAVIRSTIALKYLMAITGLLLLLFVIVHMLGNLQLFLGKDAINAYGALLKSMPVMLWSFRIGLLLLVAVHLGSAVILVIRNRQARPQDYEVRRAVGASFASRTMVFSGLIVLAFVIYHLLHFTVGAVDPSLLKLQDDQGRHDIHRMIVVGFKHPLVSGFYVLSMALLCLHLRHGASSFLQSLGWCSVSGRLWAQRLALGLAWTIFVGNSAVPIAVLLGYGEGGTP